MPNYCENDLYIFNSWDPAPASRIDPVLEFCRLRLGDLEDMNDFFERVVATPEGLADPDPEHLSDAEYAWRKEHWGTKWPAIDVRVEHRGPALSVVRFSTAWSPAVPIVAALAQRFPDVGFCLEYYERGMSFSGGWRRDPICHKEPIEWQGTYFGLRGG